MGTDDTPGTALELRPATLRLYQDTARRYVLPTFEAIALGAITPEGVREWLADLAHRNVGVRTMQVAPQVLGRVLAQAVADRRIPANPVRAVPAPRSAEREFRILTEAEVRALAEAIDPRYRAWLLLVAYGGLRFGEAAALKWSNVDLLGRRVRIMAAATEVRGTLTIGPTKTSGSRRAVSIPPFVADALAEHASVYPSTTVVFTAPEGGPIRRTNFRGRTWAPACKAAGVHGAVPHDLRHFGATLAIAAGAHPKAISARLGHANIGVTMDIYGHLLPTLDDQLAERLDEGWREGSASNVIKLPSKSVGARE